MYTLPAAALNVLIIFVLLTLPLRLIIYYAKSYKVVILSRQIADWVLLFLTIGATVSTASAFLYQPMQPGDTIFSKYILPASGAFLMVVPYFHILSWIVRRKPFYTKSHLRYLDYFTVYLRSFNDDHKGNKRKRKMTKALSNWFPVYAIGKPDEFMPPPGAKRIYVDDDWQEVVQDLILRSQIILHRINTSENYLWEFEQCHKRYLLQKSIFWVDKMDEYVEFREIVLHRFGLELPRIENRKCHVVFYFLSDWTFKVIYLTTDEDYERFKLQYRIDHAEIFEANKKYLYARREKWGQLLKFGKDSNIPDEVQQWSWTAFFLPEFYLICQQIKYRLVAFLIIIGILGTMYLAGHPVESVFRILLVRLIIMVIMGRNGRKLVWLSHHWESQRYFERNEYLGSMLAQVLGVVYIVFWVVAGIILPFI